MVLIDLPRATLRELKPANFERAELPEVNRIAVLRILAEAAFESLSKCSRDGIGVVAERTHDERYITWRGNLGNNERKVRSEVEFLERGPQAFADMSFVQFFADQIGS